MSTKRTSTHRRGERKRAGVPPPPSTTGTLITAESGCRKTSWGGHVHKAVGGNGVILGLLASVC